MNPKAQAIGSAWAQLFKQHHDAFAVELLGARASGVTPVDLQKMLQSDLINSTRLGGLQVPNMRNACNPFAFVRLVAQIIERTPSTMRAAMRDWPLDKWTSLVDAEIDHRWQTAGLPGQPLAAQLAFPLYDSIVVPTPAAVLPNAIAQPTLLAPATPPPASAMPGAPPEWLTPRETKAYTQALGRAGEFCRGLGNNAAQQVESDIAERWAGEDIEKEVLPAKRQERLDIIRQLTADAVATHKDAGQLARDLADATEDWGHNWARIARTEMQGSFNESVVLDAFDNYGNEAQIAGLSESGACDSCRELFLDGKGLPIVFPIHALVANGTNVGKKQSQWKATIWPIHPNCQCSRVVVPPGFMVLSDGRLKRLGK